MTELHLDAPYLVGRRLGRGGMAQVWRARHLETGVEVALKVITSAATRSTCGAEHIWLREVRAVAALDHPHIVTLFDHGRVESVASTPEVAPGSPWLTMELARHGTLAELPQSPHWSVLRPVLLEILGGLAHAHARGIVHRDLKPANVLVTAHTAAGGLHVKLTDFGVAWALDPHRDPLREDSEGTRASFAGSPAYMAPEQIESRWRELGPWTDLYALGCTAWELCSGQLPFAGESPMAVLLAHLRATLPALAPRVALPDDFAAWLGTLLAKDPQARFQTAADAARALEALGEPAVVAAATSEAEVTLDGMPTFGATFDLDGDTAGLMDTWAGQPTELTPPVMAPLSPTAARLPARGCSPALAEEMHTRWRDWRAAPQREHEPAVRQLLGMGVRLFGVRAVPFVGRPEARDRLWSMLASSFVSLQPRVAILRGSLGVGSSQLAQWLAEQARELGYASVWWASHGEGDGPFDGAARMLVRALHCGALSDAEREASIARHLAELGLPAHLCAADAQTLSAIIGHAGRPEARDDDASPSAVQRWQRVVALARCLRASAGAFGAVPPPQRRPLLVVIDDAHQGEELLRLLVHLLETRAVADEPLPVLFVLTVCDEVLLEHAAEQALLDQLAGLEAVETLALEPLDSEACRALCAGLVALEPQLARHVGELSQGHPLFVVQLVAAWLESGALRWTPAGFVLDAPTEGTVPDSTHALWRHRLERLAGRLGLAAEALGVLLELAAMLGTDVALDEWRAAAAHHGAAWHEALAEAMAGAGLGRLEVEQGRFVFVHRLLRDSLVRSALEAGRASAQQRSCAAMLVERYGELGRGGPVGCGARIARHWRAAGEPERALEPLWHAAWQRLLMDDLTAAAALYEDYESLLDLLALPTRDARRVLLALRRATVACEASDFERATALVEPWLDDPEVGGEVAADASLLFARIMLLRGEFETATHHAERALALAAGSGSVELEARATHRVADVDWRRGELGRALSGYERAEVLMVEAGSLFGRVWAIQGRARVHVHRGEVALARQALGEALPLFERLGNRRALANCLNSHAELERLDGRPELALAGYQRCLELIESLGESARHDGDTVRLNLGLARLALGELRVALELFEQTAAGFATRGAAASALHARAGVFAARACLDPGDATLEALLDEVEQGLAQTGMVERDLVVVFDQAHARLLAAGEGALAERVARLARAQREALG